MDATKTYDKYWESGLHKVDEWSREQFQSVMSPLVGRKNVLDYGCGIGQKYMRHLKENCGRYTGADVSDFALSKILERGGSTLRINTENGAINAEDGSFDGAASSEVMEHLYDPLSAMREIARVLKPGSPVVITVPNSGYLAWRLLYLAKAEVRSEPDEPNTNPFNGVHIRYFSRRSLMNLLEMAGFTDVRIDAYANAESSIWDILRCLPLGSKVAYAARRFLPRALHCGFLEKICPSLFAYRLRATGIKRG